MVDASFEGESPNLGTVAALSATPRGTVTFLFTDIEGSTLLLQHLGDGFADVLAQQRRLLRAAFEAHEGREIDTAGDGFFVAFDRARDAVAAAAAAQEALRDHPWPDGHRPRVRMGVHTGEPIEAGGTYVGLDVHRAARICAAGHGGQILLSRTTHELAQYDLPEGASLRDLGTYRLKDLIHAEQVSQLVHPGLESEFPPLRGSTPISAQLPTPTTPFFGRDREVRAVRDLLASPDVRLVTLTGPGGTGKTRLSIQAAGGGLGSFPDGVCFVALAAISDAELVAASIARALGFAEDPSRVPVDVLRDGLRERRALLVLDNFEHLVPAAPLVGVLLASCPRLKVLVTSRVLLRVAGEHEVAVPPLDLPASVRGARSGSGGELSPDALMAHSSIALFVNRAQAARPAWTLTADNARAVAQICLRVDGLPLAIELAAARIRLLSPQELLTRLDSRLDVLKGGSRDAPDRHRALRQTIALSYDLLSPEEQAFFRRMSVFAGGCTLSAAATVCVSCGDLSEACADDAWEALDAIERLVDHSLLRREDGPDGESRFSMLETIREFGTERLRAAGEQAPVRRAHARHYLALAEEAEPALTGPDQVDWMDRLEVEHDNLHAALSWAEEYDAPAGLRLAVALWRFWVGRGHMTEGLAWLDRLLGLPDNQARTVARGRALNATATIAHEIGDTARARACLEESLEISRAVEDRRGMALVLNNLGWLGTVYDDMTIGVERSQEALALCRELGDKRGMAVALNNLAWEAKIRSDFDRAVSLFRQSNALRLAAGDHRGRAFGLTWLGGVLEVQGRYGEGRAAIEEALEIMRDVGDGQGLANAMSFLGRLTSESGDPEGGIALLREGLAIFRTLGNRPGSAEALEFLGRALCYSERWQEATAVLEDGLNVYREIGLRWGVGDALHSLGRAAMGDGRWEDAAFLAEQSHTVRTALGDRRGVAECCEQLARLALEGGDYAAAARLLGRADALRELLGAPRSPSVRPACDATRSRLEAELGAEALGIEIAAGRAEVGAPPSDGPSARGTSS